MIDGDKWSNRNEEFILKVRDQIILEALRSEFSVIVDDTNLEPKHLNTLSELISFVNANWSGYNVELNIQSFTDIDVKECIKRDLNRDRSVGKDVIMDMYNRYFKSKIKLIEQDPDLPNAVIFDLDGTLALFGDANPYEREFAYDKLNHTVYDELMMRKSAGYSIIICSGRNGKFLEETNKWLGKNGVEPDLFLMRQEGDTRKDYIVKEEMLREHILPNYYIEAIYDDRDQVVTLWRSLGLTCFQVAAGDF